jgi:hypothetical protein
MLGLSEGKAWKTKEGKANFSEHPTDSALNAEIAKEIIFIIMQPSTL